jgi:hypothetical protein
MKFPVLQQELVAHHRAFAQHLDSFQEPAFVHSENGKWSPAQQLDHLVRSTAPVLLAFRLPTLLPSLLFGKAKQPSRTYEELKQVYLQHLQAGRKASGRFIPASVAFHQKPALLKQLDQNISKLAKQVGTFTEGELDQYRLPHPILGKLTFREMLYFTLYHVQHHHTQLR